MSAIPDPPDGYSRIFEGTWEENDLFFGRITDRWLPIKRHIGQAIAGNQACARPIKAPPASTNNPAWGTWQ